MPNYDTDRDLAPGLLLAKGTGLSEWSDPTKFQVWATPSLTADVALTGSAEVNLWSAIKNFDTTGKRGVVAAGLYDCPPVVSASCTQLATATVDVLDWQGGSASFVLKTWTLPLPTTTVAAGRRLAVKFVVEGASADDLWLAYDTSAEASFLELG